MDPQGGLNVIQAGICDWKQLGPRPHVGRGMGVPLGFHPIDPRAERAQAPEPLSSSRSSEQDRLGGICPKSSASGVGLSPVPALDPCGAVGGYLGDPERQQAGPGRPPDDR